MISFLVLLRKKEYIIKNEGFFMLEKLRIWRWSKNFKEVWRKMKKWKKRRKMDGYEFHDEFYT
jgi:hypothetical protein